MKNKYILLAGLTSVLLTAIFWALLWNPQQQNIVEARESIERIERDQESARGVIAELEDVQDREDDIRTELALAQRVLPFEPDFERTLEEMQAALDESTIDFNVVSVARPAIVEFEPRPPSLDVSRELAYYDVQWQLTGDYASLVEFIRLTESLDEGPRGVLWRQVQVQAETEEGLTFVTINASSRIYSVLPAGGIEEPVEEPEEDEDEDGEDGDDLEDELDVG